MIFGTRQLEGSDLFAPGGRRSKRVGSSSLVSALKLIIRYGYTHAETATGAALDDVSHRIARMISVKGNYRGNSVTFMNVVPRDLRTLYGMLEQRQRVQATPDFSSAPAAAETDLFSELELRFDAVGSNDPSQLGLPMGAIDGLEVIVDGAEAGDLADDTQDGTASFQGPDGTGNPVTELYEKRFLRTRPVPSALMTLHTSYDVTSSQNGARWWLPEVGPGMDIARVMVVAEADEARNDDIIDNIGLVIDGREVHEKLPRELYQRENVVARNLDDIEPGVVLYDFADDGFSDLFRVASSERPYISADAAKQAGANKVRIVTQYASRGR